MSKKVGKPSGSLIHVGERKAQDMRITLMDYDEKKYTDKEIKDIGVLQELKKSPTVSWINVEAIHEVDKIEKIGEIFELHPLLLEDVLNTEQRPKFEDFDDHIFIVFKMIYYDKKEGRVDAEQVSMVLGENYLISFQERKGDVFDQIRDRIRTAKGRVRKRGADYLAYILLDAVVDSYYSVLEKIGEEVEDIEEGLIDEPEEEILYKIHSLKRDMIYLRKSVWPLRDVVNSLTRGDTQLIKESSDIFFRDVYDHTIQVIDTIETFRDMLSGMIDLYMSSISNRMNEVMKVLTIIATIFIPLTFIAGIYGMNFNPDVSPFNMPELNWAYGYPAAIVVMLIVGIIMVIYFRKKRWL